MADPKNPAPEAVKEAVPVAGLKAGGQTVVAVPQEPEVTPPPAQPTPDRAASVPPRNEKVMADIGQLRVETAAEKRIVDTLGAEEDHWLRPAKEAHADAAKLSVLATVGTETSVWDLKRPLDENEATRLVRVRLLFDWFDGQGVPHPRGKQLDLPQNEAVRLVREGFAERADPPEEEPIVAAMTEAKMAVLDRGKK